MKYQVDYEIGGILNTGTFYGASAGEAFAKCLLQNEGCALKKCRKVGENHKGDPNPKFGITEWEPTPVQRQPPEPPAPLPKLATPKYLQPPDPMPAMRDWYEKTKSKQEAQLVSKRNRSPTR